MSMIETTDTGFAPGILSKWIRERGEGLSFADVGGLQGTVGEKVTVAYRAKCRTVTMIDAMPANSEWWEKFFAHAKQRGVPKSVIGTQIADLEKESFPKVVGTYDFVNCSGVLYHVPNPLNVVRNLFLIADRFLAIATQIIPERIENDSGIVEVPAGQALFIPSLTPGQKAVLKQFYDEQNYKMAHITHDGPPFLRNGKFSYGPSFWLPTRDMVISWMKMFGLELIDSAPMSGHGAAFLGRRG